MTKKKILIVDDDYLDIISVQRQLKKINVDHELYIAHNGVEALEMLNGTKQGESRIEPDFIMLDINMPKMTGLEFLKIIRNYVTFDHIKVFIMTTSAEDYDKMSSQRLGIAGYILKPLDFENTQDTKESSVDTFGLMVELLKK
jgi:CheY-like chemotaxis protein